MKVQHHLLVEQDILVSFLVQFCWPKSCHWKPGSSSSITFQQQSCCWNPPEFAIINLADSQQSPVLLAPRISFMEDNFFHRQDGGRAEGRWFGDDSHKEHATWVPGCAVHRRVCLPTNATTDLKGDTDQVVTQAMGSGCQHRWRFPRLPTWHSPPAVWPSSYQVGGPWDRWPSNALVCRDMEPEATARWHLIFQPVWNIRTWKYLYFSWKKDWRGYSPAHG